MLHETIKKARMYSGIPQVQIAKELFMSQSTYNRKENGKLEFTRNEVIKLAKILDLNERVVLKYWMFDQLIEIMQDDKDLLFDAFKMIEEHYDDYATLITLPQNNSSYSSLEERLKHRKKK